MPTRKSLKIKIKLFSALLRKHKNKKSPSESDKASSWMKGNAMTEDGKTPPREHHAEDADEILKREAEYAGHGEPDDLHLLVHHMVLPDTRISLMVDKFLLRVGGAASWLWIALMVVIVLNVVLRYVFGEGRVEFEEIQWHLYAIGFLIGLSYCMVADDHVRVDVLHDRFSLKTQAWVEVFGLVFFLLPFVALVLIYTIPFVQNSWEINEVSQAPAGLPYRWLIKSALLVGFALLGLAALARLTKATALLFKIPHPLPPRREVGARQADLMQE